MRAMTVPVNPRTIRLGSGKIEVGESVDLLIDLGSMDNVAFTDFWEEAVIIGGNVGEILRQKVPGTHKASVKGDLIEIELKNLHLIRGGVDAYSETTAEKVTGAKQTVNSGEWAYNKLIKIEHQNGDGSEIDVSEVKGSESLVLAAEDEYIITRNDKGEWGVLIFEPAEDGNEDQTITITYDYTPLASKTLTSGGFVKINPRIVRVTNYNAEDKKFEITVYKAFNKRGIEISLPNYNEDRVATTPIELEGICDTAKPLGNQLFKIVDEQGVLA